MRDANYYRDQWLDAESLLQEAASLLEDANDVINLEWHNRRRKLLAVLSRIPDDRS